MNSTKTPQQIMIERETVMVKVMNTTDEDFAWTWAKQKHILPRNASVTLPLYLAEHVVKHLSKREIMKNEGPEALNNVAVMDRYAKQFIVGEAISEPVFSPEMKEPEAEKGYSTEEILDGINTFSKRELMAICREKKIDFEVGMTNEELRTIIRKKVGVGR